MGLGYKFKASPGTAKAIKFLEKLYPTKKADEINLLAKLTVQRFKAIG